MARTVVDWQLARIDYEVAGNSQRAIARKYGVTHRAVQQRIQIEGWSLNVRATVQRETQAKVAGIVANDDPATKEQKVEDEAAKRADLIKRHRVEWDVIRAYTTAALAGSMKEAIGKVELSTGKKHNQSLDHIRFAKLATETIRARQDAERVAFGLDQPDEVHPDQLSDEHAAIRIMQILNVAGSDA